MLSEIKWHGTGFKRFFFNYILFYKKDTHLGVALQILVILIKMKFS